MSEIIILLSILAIIVIVGIGLYNLSKKNVLVFYSMETYHVLNDSTTWVMKYDIHTWFGVDKGYELLYTIPHNHSIGAYTDHWDKLIKTKQHFGI